MVRYDGLLNTFDSLYFSRNGAPYWTDTTVISQKLLVEPDSKKVILDKIPNTSNYAIYPHSL
ncbi:MAG: hypothetical protein WBA93_19025 [Microcoleaceae cyanobacterium]